MILWVCKQCPIPIDWQGRQAWVSPCAAQHLCPPQGPLCTLLCPAHAHEADRYRLHPQGSPALCLPVECSQWQVWAGGLEAKGERDPVSAHTHTHTHTHPPHVLLPSLSALLQWLDSSPDTSAMEHCCPGPGTHQAAGTPLPSHTPLDLGMIRDDDGFLLD